MPDAFGEKNNKYESTLFPRKTFCCEHGKQKTIIVEPNANTWNKVNVNDSDNNFCSTSILKYLQKVLLSEVIIYWAKYWQK